MITIEKVKEYLEGKDGIQISTAEDLIQALYDGEIHIEEAITYSPVKHTEEYLQTREKIFTALYEKYSVQESLDLFDKYQEFDVQRIDYQNRFCFEQGIKIGIAIHEFLTLNKSMK